MAIENWSDKMEFQGRGAAHIHGVAWCNLNKIANGMRMDIDDDDLTDEIEENAKERSENITKDDCALETELERAFFQLRMGGKLSPKEEEALIAFADKFVTCTLNPEMAATMIDENLTSDSK